jgi:hypothetical protein
MTFKKIWNALTSELRDELWNKFTYEQKIDLMADFSRTQFNRLYKKLTPALQDKVGTFQEEMRRYERMSKIDPTQHSPYNPEKEKAFEEINNLYYTAIGHLIILKEDLPLNHLEEIERIERIHFWKENEPIEKQKQDWDKRHPEKTEKIKNIQQDAFNDYGGITSNQASTYGTSNEQDEFCINPNNPHEDESYVEDESGREPYSDNSNDGRNYDEC